MSVEAKTSPNSLRQTPLHALHLDLGARMAPFAGYDMPLNYPAGVLAEHRHTRTAAGLFDISHMGQILLRPKDGVLTDAARALERLVPADILGLAQGRQRYTFFTNDTGGILDDLVVANCGAYYLLVVNAACKENDESLLRDSFSQNFDVEPCDRALIALQGPKAESALAHLAPDCAGMRFMDVRELSIMGKLCVVTRSGYTGEDGFEISIPSDVAREIAEGLLENPDVAPVGLAARDTLRLEAGLCLYGADIDAGTTPVMAGLTWTIQPIRRHGGERVGEFPGAPIILDELERGPAIHRVAWRLKVECRFAPGRRSSSRRPVRHQSGTLHRVDSVRASGGQSPWATSPRPCRRQEPNCSPKFAASGCRRQSRPFPLSSTTTNAVEFAAQQGGNLAEIHQRP